MNNQTVLRGAAYRFWIALLATVALGAALGGLLWWNTAVRSRAVETKPLVIYCAAGIRAPVEAVIHEYERQYKARVQLQYGGSGTLLGNVRVAKLGDLFVAADSQTTELARSQGLIAETLPLAQIRPVIAFRRGNPKGIHGVQDLLRQDVAVALANPEAASVGKAAQISLRKMRQWDQVFAHAKVLTPTVGEVANAIKLGTVDAGIIWDATARQSPELKMLRIAAFDQTTETVAISVLKSCQQPAAALRLARYLAARDRGLKEFARQGYGAIDGDIWAETPELVLYSGAMNRPAIEETVHRFEQREGVQVTRVYNGCGILVAQMKAGARPDAYLTCDKSFVSPVADLFPENPAELSESEIVLLVAKGNPKHLTALADLEQAGLRIGVANADQSTLGDLTRRLLHQEGILERVMVNVVTQVPTADLLVNQTRAGALDAAVVYISNTTPVRQQLDIVPLKMPQAIAVQTFSIRRNSPFRYLAERLLDSLRSEQSRQRYEMAGFHWRAGADANCCETP